MNKNITLFSAAALLLGTTANAGVLFAPAVSGLNNSSGVAPSAPMKTIALIDVDGDGLAGFDLANWDGSSFLPDADDAIVTDEFGSKGQWNENTGDGDGFEALVPDSVKNALLDAAGDPYDFTVVTNANNTPSVIGGGDAVYLFWFPELDTAATSPGAGQEFGVLLMGTLPDGFGSLTPNLVSPNSNFFASNTTVPEPTSLALLGLGGLLVARRRRG